MSFRNSCVNAWETLPVTISSGTSITGTTDLGGLRLFAISMPPAWTAANLTFQMSPDGGTTWTDLRDQSGDEIVAVTGASVCTILTPSQFAPLQYLRVRSGTGSSPVAQGADRQLQLILRPV
ncbi:MAG: hypothetical protein WC464_05390 [Bdellovibrionales bacterium]